jgi:strictosidine synthase
MMPVPFLRKVLMRLPAWLRPAPVRHGFVLGIDESGRIVHNLQGPGTAYAPITNVVEHDGHLYFGSIDADAVGRVPMPSS